MSRLQIAGVTAELRNNNRDLVACGVAVEVRRSGSDPSLRCQVREVELASRLWSPARLKSFLPWCLCTAWFLLTSERATDGLEAFMCPTCIDGPVAQD